MTQISPLSALAAKPVNLQTIESRRAHLLMMTQDALATHVFADDEQAALKRVVAHLSECEKATESRKLQIMQDTVGPALQALSREKVA